MGKDNFILQSYNRDSSLGHPDDKHIANLLFQNFQLSQRLKSQQQEPPKQESFLHRLSQNITTAYTGLRDDVLNATKKEPMAYKLNETSASITEFILKNNDPIKLNSLELEKDRAREESERAQLMGPNLLALAQQPLTTQNNNSGQGKQQEQPKEQRDMSFKIWQVSQNNLILDNEARKHADKTSSNILAQVKSTNSLANLQPQIASLSKIDWGSSIADLKSANALLLTSGGAVVGQGNSRNFTSTPISISEQPQSQAQTITNVTFGGDSGLSMVHNMHITPSGAVLEEIVFVPDHAAYVVTEEDLSALFAEGAEEEAGTNQQRQRQNQRAAKPATEETTELKVSKNSVTPFPQPKESVYPSEMSITVRGQLSAGGEEETTIITTPQQTIVQSRPVAPANGARGNGQIDGIEKNSVAPPSAQNQNAQNQNASQQAASTFNNASPYQSPSMSVDVRGITQQASMKAATPQPGQSVASVAPQPAQFAGMSRANAPITATEQSQGQNIAASQSRLVRNAQETQAALAAGLGLGTTGKPSTNYALATQQQPAILPGTVNMKNSAATLIPTVKTPDVPQLERSQISGTMSTSFVIPAPKPTAMAVDIKSLATSFSGHEAVVIQPQGANKATPQQSVDVASLSRLSTPAPRGPESSETAVNIQLQSTTLKVSSREPGTALTATLGGTHLNQQAMKDGMPLNTQMKTTISMGVEGVVSSARVTVATAHAEIHTETHSTAAPVTGNLQMKARVNGAQEQAVISALAAQSSQTLQKTNAQTVNPVEIQGVHANLTPKLTQKLTGVMSTTLDGTHTLQMSARPQHADAQVQGIKTAQAMTSGQIANAAATLLRDHGPIAAEFAKNTQVQFTNANAQRLNVIIDRNGQVNTGALSKIAADMAAEKSTLSNIKKSDRRNKKSASISAVDAMQENAQTEGQDAAGKSNPFDRPDEDSHSFTHHTLSVVAGIIRVSQQEGTAQAGIVQQMGYAGGSTVTTGDDMWQDLSVHLKAQVHASRELRRPTTGDIKIMLGDVSGQTPLFKLAGIPQTAPALQMTLPHLMAPEFNVSRHAQETRQHAMAG